MKKIVAINCRPENSEDFYEIGRRVVRNAQDVGVIVRPGTYVPEELYVNNEKVKLLNLYLVNPPESVHEIGHSLFVKPIDKLDQVSNYKLLNISTPHAENFEFGKVYSPEIFGEYVLLKAKVSSLGENIYAFKLDLLNNLNRDEIPEGHPLLSNDFYIQRYINLGSGNPGYRVMCLLGEPLLSYRWVDKETKKFPQTLEESLKPDFFAAKSNERQRELVIDNEVIDFAKEAFTAHIDRPIQGIDVIRDCVTGKLYVLESNCGGNVWSFSMKNSNPYRAFGRKAMILQFKAWDVAARVIIEKTRQLAV